MTLPRLLLGVRSASPLRAPHPAARASCLGAANDGSLIGELASAGCADAGAARFRSREARCGQARPGPAGGGDQRVRRRADERQGPGAARMQRRIWCSTAPCAALDAVGAPELVIALDEPSQSPPAMQSKTRSPSAPTSTERLHRPSSRCHPATSAVRRPRSSHSSTAAQRCRHAPPRVTERGIGRRPTLVSNAETLAHAALIARHGADGFAGTGTAEEPGTALVTLSGPVRDPAVYEIEYDTGLTELLDAAGGLNEPVRAFLIGGYAGTWIRRRQAAALRLSRAGLRPFGAALGAGIVVALPEQRLPGRRGRPRSGVDGRPERRPVRALRPRAGRRSPTRWPACARGKPPTERCPTSAAGREQISGRGACAHPDGAVGFVASALSTLRR